MLPQQAVVNSKSRSLGGREVKAVGLDGIPNGYCRKIAISLTIGVLSVIACFQQLNLRYAVTN